MKRVAALAGVVLLVALYGSSTSAQEPPPDQGDTNLLAIACDYLRKAAEANGLQFRNCRQVTATDYTSPARAVAHVRVKLEGFRPLEFQVYMQKSLWTVQAFL